MNDENVMKAIRNCGTLMTHSKFWSKAALSKAARKAKADKCVHFLTNVPNSKEGWAFINQMKKYLHKGRYSIRLKGRGSRKVHGNQSFIPLPHAERYSVYIDYKIKDSNSPGYNQSKTWQYEMKLRNIRGDLQQLINRINELVK